MRNTIFPLLLIGIISCTSSPQGSTGDVSLQDSLSTDTTHRLTLLFAGDMMQHITQIEAAACADGSYDYTDCFRYIEHEIQQADMAFANLEVTLGGRPYRGYPCFSAPDEYLWAIRHAGFDGLLTANNHSMDRGRRGLVRTIQMIDSLQMHHVGTYVDTIARQQLYPLILEKKGIKVAILNYTYDTNGIPVDSPSIVNLIQREVMAKDIQKARSLQPDAIIACMHWGDEYTLTPNRQQRDLADWLLQQGVTHVIGGHPHVVQPLEVRTDSITGGRHLVAYSLGNLLSNMSRQDTDGGLLLRLTLEKDSTTRLADCAYSLVWVTRPVVSGHKVHRLYPAANPPDSLNEEERMLLEKFTHSARELFNKENQGIREYTF